ncbi:DNA polymerase III subunit alpha [Patulibacter defluvii]|uniref:DNA polymerase III subunit alpha n=1 Tax=Patulibacter defluvii TaxID=3095358 RepID=UPI002A7631C6|nr:PHP domain-containing protein [Patulibacter sp. DM4]
MSSTPYVELHCHSAYSFLDGASLPEELLRAAKREGYGALALTDHDTVAGAMEFAKAAAELEMKAIHGAEVTVVSKGLPPMREGRMVGDWELERTPTRHLTLLVEHQRGWRNLCRLLTVAHARTRDHPQRTAGRPWITIGDLAEHAEGLVCLSGCADHGFDDADGIRSLLQVFDRDHLYVELQRRYLRDDRDHARTRTELARRFGLRCVATGNVHAHSRQRARLQDALVAVRHRTTLDASEPLRRGNHSHALAGPQAMVRRFEDQPEAVAETVRLAERLVDGFDLTTSVGYRYPGQEDAEMPRKLAAVCNEEFEKRYVDERIQLSKSDRRSPAQVREQARRRLDEELRLIAKLDLSGFFHLHHEILQLAAEVAAEVRGTAAARALLAPGRGRGSSVSSIVCYLTGLSHVDPIANDLSIGRFLHADLQQTLPDIDLDFPRDIREVLIPRVNQRYGQERAALVAAFPTYRARGAIRDLGMALGLPAVELERVARGSEGWSGRSVAEDIAAALGLRLDGGVPHADAPLHDEGSSPPREPIALGPPAPVAPGMEPPWRPLEEDPGRGLPGRWAWLARLASMAHGLPRHLSQHPGGMIISTQPLIDCCPVVPSAMEGRQMIMWDKDSCSDAGFAKIDLLGLGMLSCVERCVELISARPDQEQPFDLARVPLDDEETYEAIQKADTTGVFQIESRAQMGSLLRTRPRTLEDLTIQVAIVRPGPIQGGAVNPYIERKQRLRDEEERGVPEAQRFRVPVLHPSLEEPLRQTLGTILFQDQVVEIAQKFAGFSPGRAEGVRRAMSRKRSEEAMEEQHEAFVQGAIRTHDDVTPELAEHVWGMVKGFSGFGFPKAHAVAFGLLAYQSTWLRVHRPLEFLCALLNEQPMGFYPPDALIHEADRRGIEVRPPDVRHSDAECTTTADGAIRLGLGYVKGVHRHEVAALVEERRAHGPWRSIGDLVTRLGTSIGSLEQLAWAGACDELVGQAGVDGEGSVPEARRRRAALWQLGLLNPGRRVRSGTQLALELEAAPAARDPQLAEMTPWERLIADYATTGLTAGPHPMRLLRNQVEPRGVTISEQLKELRHGRSVQVAGLVLARQRPGSAKGVVFLLLEDEEGTINLVVPPEVYLRDRQAVRTEPLVVAEGRLEKLPAGGGQINVLVRRIRALDELTEDTAATVRTLRTLSPEQLEQRARQAEEEPELIAVGGGVAPRPGGFRPVAPNVMHFGRGRGGRR